MKHHLFVGIDRSDRTIDACTSDASGTILREEKIGSAPENLMPWVRTLLEALPDGATAAICIESPCQNLTSFFRQHPRLTVYLVNPVTLKRYRDAFTPSRAKDDRRDARALSGMLYERHAKMRAWCPPDAPSDTLARLTEKRRQLVDIRTSLTNRLTGLLKEYYPQALGLVGRDLHTPLSLAFLKRWPDLDSLKRTRPATLTAFYCTHRSGRPELVEKRLKLISNAVPLCTDKPTIGTCSELTLALVDSVASLARAIRRFDKLIAEAAAAHEDAEIFSSLPGAGDNFSARLMAYFGADRSRFGSAEEVQRHCGVAPVTKQSGKTHFVHRRYACPKFSRQTFVEWAGQTVVRSVWAKAYYHQQKQKGKRHHNILRGLAYKWIRVLYRCWKEREPYNEARYIEALRKSGSPLAANL